MKTFAEGLGLESEPFIKACTVLKWDDAENTFKLGAELPGPYIPFDREEDQDEAPYFITVNQLTMATALPPDVSESAALDYLDKEVSSDLVHIFQECGVPLGLQYRLALNFKNVKRFSTYADTRGDVRTAFKDDQALEATNQATRAAVASVVSAWETSKDYASKESELRAEARMLGVSRPVTQTEKQAMRIAFEAAHGGLES
eukprot:s11152_g1.t1